MPDGRLDVGLGAPLPVVAGVDGSVASVAAAHEAAHEAVLRGAVLELVAVPRAEVPAPRGSARAVPGAVDDLAAGLAELHPGLPVAARAVPGGPAGVLASLSREAGLLVLGARGAGGRRAWARGSVVGAVLRSARCPVLLGRRDTGLSGAAARVVVVHAEGDLARALPLVDVALAAAARRGAALLVLRPYAPGPGEDAPRALRRVRGVTAALLDSLCLDLVPEHPVVTTVHTRDAGPSALAWHARDAEQVVVDAARLLDDGFTTVLAGLRAGVVAVPRGARDRREGCLALYRQTLLAELAATPRRGDGCRTPEELDDAWRVGTARPAVGTGVATAWQACLQAAVDAGAVP